MVGYRNSRVYGLIFLGLIFSALLLYVPRTDLPRKSKELVQDLLVNAGLSKGKQEPNHGSNMQQFDFEKYFFQANLDFMELPHFDTAKLKDYPPVHYHGPGRPTFATFYASRNSTMHDPYFFAAQQILYRLLWDPRSRSKQYPVTIFVAPFISQEQRDYFAAAGAVVRELPLRLFSPEFAGVPGRLADMFSKLEMWSETDYSTIAYLDSDAFPVNDIDHIFDLAKSQHCKTELLPPEDLEVATDMCDYTFAAYNEFGDQVNAGVLVFSPNINMHKRLVRESLNTSNFDNGFMEQALLNYAYSLDGPFPASHLPHNYNGGTDMWKPDVDETPYIVHAKIWALIGEMEKTWYKHTFNYTWLDMRELYESEQFEQLRAGGATPTIMDESYCCRDLKPEYSITKNPPLPSGWPVPDGYYDRRRRPLETAL